MSDRNNNVDITEMPYAQWLERALRDISELPIRGIALVGTLEGGDIYTDYYNIPMADKLMLAGIINQDATLDMLEAQGIINYEDTEEEETDGEEEE